jgi:putative transposase
VLKPLAARRLLSAGGEMAQSLAKVYVHVVFSTKDRELILGEDWRDELFRVMGGTVNKSGCQSLIVGGVADHVHMLFILGRTVTIADAVGRIKSASSAWVNDTRRVRGRFQWQGGYSAFSVSESGVAATREYIARQAEHHARVSFQDELRAFLKEHGLQWDEKYLWE